MSDIKSKILGDKITSENLTPDGKHFTVRGRAGFKDHLERDYLNDEKKREKRVKDGEIKKKKNKWKLEVKNVMSGDVEETYYFPSLSQLAVRIKMFNYDTWRNIALGRSKTYNKFVNLSKI